MRCSILIFFIIFCSNAGISQQDDNYPKAPVSISDYEELLKEVKEIRAQRLISFDEFLTYQKEENTVVLDTRSKANYDAIHIKGAINLPFTEFTTQNLRQLIPNTKTRILIYCNNNIKGDPIYFGSKTYSPEDEKRKKKYYKSAIIIEKNQAFRNMEFITLALNIPTYINLYGYGYTNIYELDELVDIRDERINFHKPKNRLGKKNRKN